MEAVLFSGPISLALSFIGFLVFKYFQREQKLVYDLKSRDLGIKEREADLKIDYHRELMLEGKLALPDEIIKPSAVEPRRSRRDPDFDYDRPLPRNDYR